MEVHFVGAIEQLTHRSVKAFLSASRQNVDITVELFVLGEEAQTSVIDQWSPAAPTTGCPAT